ncbi:MAG: cytochrome b/b6 domain-containing protein [Bacillota bacterium]|nr:cytochrome b/b6 domain-containing protein [Bacillota bacterium]
MILHQPLPLRLLHWTHTLGLMAVLLTGLYLHHPFTLPLLRAVNLARRLHLMGVVVVYASLALRLYYGLVVRDLGNLLFKWEDLRALPALLRYYFFLSPHKPPQGKYNAGQKLEYTSWAVLFVLQAITGLILYAPRALLGWTRYLGGGLVAVRWLHFGVALYFLVTLTLHTYLVFIEDPERFKAMFSGYIDPRRQPPS